jgi:UDP-N-acetyl-D-mannosaminuronate dehydrogenase
VSQVSVGVVGLGYWGPNLARTFDRLGETELRWICDASEDAIARAKTQFPSTRTTTSLDDLLNDDELDAIVVATPVPLHAELGVRVLEAGKHCFVEKPLAQSVAVAERVVEAAERADKIAGALNDHSKPVRGSKIVVIGISYKAGVGDLRESPGLKILRILRERGADVMFHDDYVGELQELGLGSEPLDEALRSADCAVIVTAHPELDVEAVVRDAPLVVDFRGVTRGIKAANLVRL